MGRLGEAVLCPVGTLNSPHCSVLPNGRAGNVAWVAEAHFATYFSHSDDEKQLSKAVMKVMLKAGLKSHFFCPLII